MGFSFFLKEIIVVVYVFGMFSNLVSRREQQFGHDLKQNLSNIVVLSFFFNCVFRFVTNRFPTSWICLPILVCVAMVFVRIGVETYV